MKPKIIGIITIVVGIVLLAATIYFFMYSGNNEPDGQIDDTQNANTLNTPDKTLGSQTSGSVASNNAVTQEKKKVANEKFGESDLKKMAMLFAERFGSFSNQSNFRNVSDLKIFMTEKMEKWADSYIAEQNAKMTDNSIYYGIITKAVTSEVKQFDESAGQASVLVKTRRRETAVTENNSSNNYNQDVLINFTKENNLWKVNDAFWQSK